MGIRENVRGCVGGLESVNGERAGKGARRQEWILREKEGGRWSRVARNASRAG